MPDTVLGLPLAMVLLAAGIAIVVTALAAARDRWVRPHTVEVVYRSGHVQRIRCRNWTVRSHQDGTAAEVTWAAPWPLPLHVGVGQIESVWQHR